MASKRGMSYRNEGAQSRIDAAVERIAAAGAFEVEPRPVYRRDPIRQETERLERLAGVLEQVVSVLDGGRNDPNRLASLTRKELNAMATDLGIEKPADLPNKDAVIAAIEEAAETSGEDG